MSFRLAARLVSHDTALSGGCLNLLGNEGPVATDLLALDELDEVLRWDGRQGAVGLSAIDGLVASVVAGPVTVPRTRWLPLIFDNKMPKTKPNSLERRIVDTILAHFKAVEDSVRFAPENSGHSSCTIWGR